MADHTLTQLASAELPLSSTDLFYIVQHISTSTSQAKITFADLSTEVGGLTTVAGSNVILDKIGTPTYKTDQDYIQIIGTAGAIVQGAAYLSDAGGGNVDVAGGSGLIRIADSNTAGIRFFDWSAATGFAVPAGTTRYFGIDYNAGSPIVVMHTTEDWNYHSTFPLGNVTNDGVLHINQDGREIADCVGHLIHRWYQTHPLERDERLGGLIIGEGGTRNVTLSAGKLWDRSNEFSISALNTASAGSFDAYYRDGGAGFTKVASQTQWPNTQYDDGTGTLHTLAANKFGNLWWYLETDGNVVMLYGRNTYNNAAAAALEAPPSTVPARITAAGRLIGRFVFQASAATATQIDSVFSFVFSPSAVTSHANLSNLAWTTSGHTGTPFSLASFVTSTGAAGEITIPNDATKFLRGDATFAVTGDVAGPASAVDGHLAVFDGTTGKLIKDGGAPGAGGAMPPQIFTAASNNPPATAFATLDTRNSHLVLDFDGATDEEAVFAGVLPASYAGGGLTVSTWWSFTSATSGSLRVQAAIERIDVSSLDIDADSFASFNSAGGTAPGTSGQVIKVDITFTAGAQMDSLAAGEAFRVKIRRDADGTSGTDDITTDAELLRVLVRET